jgi:hypothetical protein
MSSSQYRRDLERTRRQRADSEKRAGELRAKEAEKRSAATRAREAARRTHSASTAASRSREAERLETSANQAGKAAADWQTKAARYLQAESALLVRIAQLEESERQKAERHQKRLDQEAARRAARERSAIDERLRAAESLASNAYLATRQPKRERLRILMLGAASDGDLRVGREQKRIRAAVQSALHRDAIEMDPRPAATPGDLLDGLTKFRPHIVHFSGHGDEDLIVFEDEIDQHHEGVVVTASAFARALAAVDEPPLLVVLNACNSAAQLPFLVGSVAPFAIGMSAAIEDGDAINYAAQFYAAVADGQSILAAHRLAQAALELSGLTGPDLPALDHADDADPATTILVRSSA